MSAGTPARRPRVRTSIRVVAILALVVLVPTAAYRVWDHVELQRLIREIEAIRTKGEPVTVQWRSEPVEERDAEGREVAARAAPPASGRPAAGSYYAAAGTITPMLLSGFYPLDEIGLVHGWIAGAIEKPPSLDTIGDDLRRKTAEVHDALALADTGAALPFTHATGGTEYNVHAQGLAQVSFAIAARTVGLSLAGDGDRAVESALSALQFRRGLRNVEFPVRGDHEVAVILSASRPSVDHLVRLQRALESEDDPDRAVEELLRARARYLEQLWRRYYGAPWILQSPRPSQDFPRGWLSRRIAHTLRIWADVIDAARTPWPQKRQAADEVRRRYASEQNPAAGLGWLALPGGPPVVVSWGPTIALEQLRRITDPRPVGDSGPARLIVDRSARVAVAIERYRRDHRSALPETLDALVPRYLSDVPDDPLTGASLRYRVEPAAYVVYSVGADLADNDGALLLPGTPTPRSPPVPPGAVRRFAPGPDIGVRVLIRAGGIPGHSQ